MTWTIPSVWAALRPRSRRQAFFLPRPSPLSVDRRSRRRVSPVRPIVLPAPPPADPPPGPEPPAPPGHNYEYYNPNDYNDWWYNQGADGGGWRRRRRLGRGQHSGRGQRLVAADDIRRAVQAEILQGDRGEAGRVALRAQHHPLHVVADGLG